MTVHDLPPPIPSLRGRGDRFFARIIGGGCLEGRAALAPVEGKLHNRALLSG